MSEPNQGPQPIQIDSERIIGKLRVQLSDVNLELVKTQAVMDMLMEENTALLERVREYATAGQDADDPGEDEPPVSATPTA